MLRILRLGRLLVLARACLATAFNTASKLSADSSHSSRGRASRHSSTCIFATGVLIMALEYVIHCDESETKGRHFSNFYGAALVTSEHIDSVRKAIAAKKLELNLFGECKWSKITPTYRKKYIELIDFFFDLIRDRKVKIRQLYT